MTTRPTVDLALQNDDYVQVDVSEQFSKTGKACVALLCIAVGALILFLLNSPKKKAGISLASAVLMIGLRFVLEKTGHGPGFQVWERLLFWKPLIVQFGLMMTTIGLERTESDGLVRTLGLMLDGPVPSRVQWAGPKNWAQAG